MRSIFTNRNISLKSKIRILKAYVWSVLLYGSECWTLNRAQTSKLEAAEMWFLRRILKISWTERITNEEVLRRAKIKRSLIPTIREKQMKFFGHIFRKQSIEHLILTGKISGKKGRGRQRLMYLESLKKYIQNRVRPNLTTPELFRLAGDRKEWRAMVADVCSRPGT